MKIVYLLIFLLTHNCFSQNRLEWLFTGKADSLANFTTCRLYGSTVLSDGSYFGIGSAYPDSSLFVSGKDTVKIGYKTFIIRISRYGKVLFVRPFNKNLTDSTYDQLFYSSYLVSDSAKNVYIATRVTGHWDFDSSGVTTNLNEVVTIFKLNSNGDLIHRNTYPGSVSPYYLEYINGIFLDNKNRLIFSTLNYNNGYGVLILDSALNLITTRVLFTNSPANYNRGIFICGIDTSGKFLVKGFTLLSHDIDPGGLQIMSPGQCHFIGMLDSSFNLIHHLIFPVNSIFQVSFDRAYNIILNGSYSLTQPNTLVIDSLHPDGTIYGSGDLVAKFTPQFQLIWNKWAQYVNGGSNCNFLTNQPFSNQFTSKNELLLHFNGRINPGFNNFNFPELETPIDPFEPIGLYQLLTFDSTGNITTNIPLQSSDYARNMHLIEDSILYFMQYPTQEINYSLNEIPVNFISSPNGGFALAKYQLKFNKYSVQGNLIADLNSNILIDSVDSRVPNHVVYLDSTDYITLSDGLGRYTINCDSGFYNIKTNNSTNFNSSVPNNIPVLLNDFNPKDTGNNFFFTPENFIYDFNVNIISSRLRPGNPSRITFVVKNKGTLSAMSTLLLKFNSGMLHYQTSSITPWNITSDSIIWSMPVLKPFEKLVVTADFIADTTIQNGDTAFFYSEIQPSGVSQPDNYPSDNFDTTFSITTTSLDPNYKESNRPSTIPITELDSNLSFKYIVHFQNIGNDTAFKVVIADTLPINADLSSFEWIGSSHNGIPYIIEGNILVVQFKNILLPDSTTNERESHGFIAYRIRPKLQLVPGDSIVNRADIYFDYNTPVKTNHSTSIFTIPAGITSPLAGYTQLLVYPNPVSKSIFVRTADHALMQELTLFDFTGRKIENKINNEEEIVHFDLSERSNGVYFLHVLFKDNRTSVCKIIKL